MQFKGSGTMRVLVPTREPARRALAEPRGHRGRRRGRGQEGSSISSAPPFSGESHERPRESSARISSVANHMSDGGMGKSEGRNSPPDPRPQALPPGPKYDKKFPRGWPKKLIHQTPDFFHQEFLDKGPGARPSRSRLLLHGVLAALSQWGVPGPYGVARCERATQAEGPAAGAGL